MFTVYILYSEKFSKIYIGYTSNMEQRLISHDLLATKGFTVKFRPWKIIYTEEYTTKEEAMKRELWLKSGIGRNWIKGNVLVK